MAIRIVEKQPPLPEALDLTGEEGGMALGSLKSVLMEQI